MLFWTKTTIIFFILPHINLTIDKIKICEHEERLKCMISNLNDIKMSLNLMRSCSLNWCVVVKWII